MQSRTWHNLSEGLGHYDFSTAQPERSWVHNARGIRTCQTMISGSDIMPSESVSRPAKRICREVPEFLSGRKVRTHVKLVSPCEITTYLGYHKLIGIKWRPPGQDRYTHYRMKLFHGGAAYVYSPLKPIKSWTQDTIFTEFKPNGQPTNACAHNKIKMYQNT